MGQRIVNVFNRIPENFFNLLAGAGNRRMNAGCLVAAYNTFDSAISYRISRDIVRGAIARYLEDEGYSEPDPEEGFLSPNDRANAVIRNFYDAGWLEEDMDEVTYEKMIVMTSYGIALAEFLIRLTEPEKDEYAMYLYNIYNTLKTPAQWKAHPYTQALKPAYRYAKDLANSLKKLSTSIKDIISELYKEETLEGLDKNLHSYLHGSFIKEYSRLVEEQNIHVYRPVILRDLENMRNDPAIMQQIAEECMIEEKLTESDADDRVHRLFTETAGFLGYDYDQIMEGIQMKIGKYLGIAVGKLRFMANRDDNLHGYVEQCLKYMTETYNSGEAYDTSGLFKVYTQSYVDVKSLKYPNKPRSIKTMTEIEIPDPDPEDLRVAAEAQKKDMDNPYSRERIGGYARHVMNGRKKASAKDFPLDTKEEMLKIMAMIAQAADIGYRIERKQGYVNRNGITIGDFDIEEVATDGSTDKA